MRKYVLLLLIVLATGTTAWGTIASVMPPEDACACEELYIHVGTCLPYECDARCTKVCVRGSTVIVDMYYGCEDCKCGGATCIDGCVNIGEFCPGVYSVIVRIYCMCEDSCCCRRPRICAFGTTFFRVAACCAPEP
jgi:hypothetical protein